MADWHLCYVSMEIVISFTITCISTSITSEKTLCLFSEHRIC